MVKGLAVGDQVVIDGTDRLRDGAKIRRPGAAPGDAGRPVAAAPPAGSTPAGSNGTGRGNRRSAARARRRAGGEAAQGANGERRGGGAGRPAQSNQ